MRCSGVSNTSETSGEEVDECSREQGQELLMQLFCDDPSKKKEMMTVDFCSESVQREKYCSCVDAHYMFMPDPLTNLLSIVYLPVLVL